MIKSDLLKENDKLKNIRNIYESLEVPQPIEILLILYAIEYTGNICYSAQYK